MATLTTSQTLLFLKNPKTFSPTSLKLKPNPQFLVPLNTKKPKFATLKISSTQTTPSQQQPPLKTLNSLPSDPLSSIPTRTLTTLFALSSTLLKSFVHKAQPLSAAVGVKPLLFAAVKYNWTLNKPLTVVAAGLSKWLDIFSAVLIVRVLLSWFPNVPWDKQPMPAIRGLCDPYLNLFRNVIPPVFSTLDMSPLLAFAILGVVGSLLKGGQGGF